MASYTITGDGNTTVMTNWRGGKGYFTLSGATVNGTSKLQFSGDKTNWIDVGNDATRTTAGGAVFDLPVGVDLRVNTSGSSSPNMIANILS